jgi:site-specific DNA-methyltransferase (adenine-specific)/modification methylase
VVTRATIFFLDDSDRQVFLLEHIIKIGSNESSLVFDPFMGVGSTGVAAIKLKRKFLGIEIEQSYFKAAQKRIKETFSQKSLL